MTHKLYISVLTLFLSANASAYHLIDSIGVSNENGKKVIIYRISKSETYYSIGQRYKIDYRDIIKYNKNANLRAGTIIKIPTQLPFQLDTSAPTIVNATTSRNNGQMTTHRVQGGESIYSIARQYGSTPQRIIDDNRLKKLQLRVGQVLNVYASQQPTNSPTITTIPSLPIGSSSVQEQKNNSKTGIQTQVEEKSKTEVPKPQQQIEAAKPRIMMHQIQGNETLYSIASKYKITMNKLVEDNNIQNYQISVGQYLYIHGDKQAYLSQNNSLRQSEEDKYSDPNADITIKDPKLRKDPSVYGLSQVEEKGSAMWIEDKDLDNTKMLVLHKSAPVGTIIRISNPLNSRSTFAKVVGSFSENEATKNIIVLMTKAVSNALGAIDKKFYCNINYGIPSNNEQ